MVSVKIHPYTLEFKKPATTSRGELVYRYIYYIELCHAQHSSWGEAGTLPGLSIDDVPHYVNKIQQLSYQSEIISELHSNNAPFTHYLDVLELYNFPSVSFALECALTAIPQRFTHCLFHSPFFDLEHPIPINGLVWMDHTASMLQQVDEKVQQGFTCIKLKIGALDFDEECRMLETIRKKYQAFQIELRVDANGAFAADTALKQLHELKRFDLHSIEQPIKAGQWDMMEELCAKSKLRIALDEELIGVLAQQDGERMLRKIKPAYIILKPSLLGGFTLCNQWITAAQQNNTGYWITSALESNIGLNAIAQYTATLNINIPQGLGTGQLYTNNIPSPLYIQNGQLYYAKNETWDLSKLLAQTI